MARSVAKRTTSSAPDTKFRSANDIKLPGELDLHRFDLAQACVHTEDPRNWPEEEPPCVVLRAYGPEEIAKILIKQFHVGIRKCSIAYLWTENMGQGAKVTLGKAAKASARWQFIAQVDFVLVFNHSAWRILTEEQKIALVDHELMHCDIDGEKDKAMIVPHDIEEFATIVKRWGLWKPDLQSFGDACVIARQGDLFAQPTGAGLAAVEANIKRIGDDVAALTKSDPMREIMKRVVDEVNSGALDKDGVKATATMSGGTMKIVEDQSAHQLPMSVDDFANHPKPPAASKVTPLRAD